MIATSHRLRGLKDRSSSLLRHLWQRGGRLSRPLLEPCHCDVPPLRDAEIAAVYHGRRIAGDFYECIRVSPCRVLFALLDVAGRRADTRDILIAAQNTFRNMSSPCSQVNTSTKQKRCPNSATILIARSCSALQEFVFVRPSLVASMKMWEHFVIPMRGTRPDSSLIAAEPASWKRPGFP